MGLCEALVHLRALLWHVFFLLCTPTSAGRLMRTEHCDPVLPEFVKWCDDNYLDLNVSITKKMIMQLIIFRHFSLYSSFYLTFNVFIYLLTSLLSISTLTCNSVCD